jgi:hypothetical protein
MAYENLLVEHDGAVAIVTVNRPQVLNALNAATLDALAAAMGDLQRHERVRVVILTGSGERAFVAGADINELVGQTPIAGREHALTGQHVFALIENLGKPVIAAINGYALGGGCELAMACTLRLAADTAKIGQPEITLACAGLRRHAAAVAARGQREGDGADAHRVFRSPPKRREDWSHQSRGARRPADGRSTQTRTAGGKRADRDALHHERDQSRPRDAVRDDACARGDVVRAVASTEDMREGTRAL